MHAYFNTTNTIPMTTIIHQTDISGLEPFILSQRHGRLLGVFVISICHKWSSEAELSRLLRP